MSKKNKYVFVVKVLLIFGFLFLFKNHSFAEELPWIKASGSNLVKGKHLFKFIGATGVNLLFYDDWGLDIERAITEAKKNNILVLRFYLDWKWAKYEDFDRILDLASKNGVYVILSLADCCCSGDFSGGDKYFQVHAPLCDIKSNSGKKAFKTRIRQIVQRRNTVNAKVYRDDPTILAWEIANELEYWRFSESDVRIWTQEIASFVKALDKNHLISMGINMGGQDVSASNHVYKMFNVPELDFFSFHYYPAAEKYSQRMELDRDDLDAIANIAKNFINLGKPVIIGEFGFSNSIDLNSKTRSDPDKKYFYNLAFKKIMDTVFDVGCSGAMFWGWGIPEERGIPMWWNKESHSENDKDFCVFLKSYKIPGIIDAKN